jgi:hypothetical protein
MNKVLMFVTMFPLALGCGESSPDSCKVTCATDADCPDGQGCGELGLCSAGEACPCEVGEFRGCDGDLARFCNAAADGLEAQTCAAGCNSTAGRCNVCVPDADACTADGSFEQCGPDGLPAATSACRLACVPADASMPAHCGHLAPLFFPTLCDEVASSPELILADVTLDTSADATCTGGIVAQTGGPAVCVIRHSRITIGNDVVVRGDRAIAFVADEAVLVQGTLDVSADATSSGAGGGAQSGDGAGANKGGGGAGFGTAGGAGGTGAGGAGTAGGVLDPLLTMVFVGGRSPTGPTLQQGSYPIPGGGGGAVMLVACRGDVVVSGMIDAGGGGGQKGRDTNPTGLFTNPGGAGGGTGGYVVLQGIEVNVTSVGSGGVFANGGAGGGGCAGDGCLGSDGPDATRSTTGAMGGGPGTGGGSGGSGGATFTAAGAGEPATGPGGGGGAVGRLQICRPDVGTVSVSATVSPLFQPDVTISTR